MVKRAKISIRYQAMDTSIFNHFLEAQLQIVTPERGSGQTKNELWLQSTMDIGHRASSVVMPLIADHQKRLSAIELLGWVLAEHRDEFNIPHTDLLADILTLGLPKQILAHGDPGHLQIWHFFLQSPGSHEAHAGLAGPCGGFNQDAIGGALDVAIPVGMAPPVHVDCLLDDPFLVRTWFKLGAGHDFVEIKHSGLLSNPQNSQTPRLGLKNCGSWVPTLKCRLNRAQSTKAVLSYGAPLESTAALQ